MMKNMLNYDKTMERTTISEKISETNLVNSIRPKYNK